VSSTEGYPLAFTCLNLAVLRQMTQITQSFTGKIPPIDQLGEL